MVTLLLQYFTDCARYDRTGKKHKFELHKACDLVYKTTTPNRGYPTVGEEESKSWVDAIH